MISKKKYFAGFMGKQEKWLNKMAEEGYRLVSVGKLQYDFEECNPKEYVYTVEYAGYMSGEQLEDYKAFLEECGYKVFYKNINLDYSVYKVTYRPGANKSGRISSTNTTYNKELLIVEKKNDGKPFELHTSPEDKIDYYERVRNPWIFITYFLLAITALTLSFISLVFAIVTAIPALMLQRKIIKLRKEVI